METYKRNSVGAATFYAYQNRLKLHVYPVIGHLRLTDVKPIHADIGITAKIYTHHSEVSFDNARLVPNKFPPLVREPRSN